MSKILDIQLAKTFLEIMSSGSFLEAAKQLHVTQTTVTARVKTLEESLGCKLFVRNRSGASLTEEGERFVGYAKNLVLTWQKAKIDLSTSKEMLSGLKIGVGNSLWNPLLVETITQLQENFPSLSIDARVENVELLLKQLEQGDLDAVIVYKPKYRSNFVVELLMEEKLIHVQSTKNPQPNLFVDWGEEFKIQYDTILPQPRQTGFKTNLGPLAMQVILSRGGNGYFRTRVVEKYLVTGELEKVIDAPEFSYPVYLLYAEQSRSDSLRQFIQVLKQRSKNLDHWII